MKKNYSEVASCSVCQKYFKSKPKGWSNLYCSKPCAIMGGHNKLKATVEQSKNLKEYEYSLNPKLCLECNKPLNYLTHNLYKFCSRSCGAKHNNKQRIIIGWSHSKKTRMMLSEHAKNHPTGCILNSKQLKNLRQTKNCPVCRNKFTVAKHKNKRIYCSRTCYLGDIGAKFRKKQPGGMREGSGRAKTGWYKGIYCGSTYELAFLIYNLDHNKDIKRYNGYFQYIWEGKHKKYYPDFIIDDVVYEIKGRIQPVDNIKIKTANAILIDKEAILPYINYVVDRYKVNKDKLYLLYED